MVEPTELDLFVFREKYSLAQEAEDLPTRARLLREALAQWRDRALVDVPSDVLHAAGVPRLEEERLTVLEQWFQVELELGNHSEVTRDLFAVAGENSLRESFHALLMTALHRSGRQADAFAAYERIKKELREQLGVDPGAQLRSVHQRLLEGDAPGIDTVSRPPRRAPVVAVPHELPSDVSDFVGREDTVEEIADVLTDPVSGASLAVLSGPPGVGKTALAIKVAHGLRDVFADGQLYADLRGYASSPALSSMEVLARFLVSLGVEPDQVPAQEDALVTRFRSLLADRRVLIVLDNAANPAQVRPLLPSGAGCGVLITSRNELRGLSALQGARLFTLDVLPVEQAVRLVTNSIGAERVGAEPDAAVGLVEICGRLPLALRISAANISARHDLSIGEYVTELRQDNLASLEIDGDEQAAVRSAFELSYRMLAPPVAQIFRMLGLVPGPDFTVVAVAALTDRPPDEAGRLLDRLAMANLVSKDSDGRYRLHDLLRVYAAEQCARDEGREAAVRARERLFTFYLKHVDAGASLLYPMWLRLPRPASLAQDDEIRFAGSADATEWMGRECVNVLAAVVDSAQDELSHLAWFLIESLRPYLVTSGQYREEAFKAADAAMRAAIAQDNRPAQAAIRNTVGAVYNRHGQHNEAMRSFAAELAVHREVGNVAGQARALIALGNVTKEFGPLEEAAVRIREGLGLAAEAGSHKLLRFGWLNLSHVETLLGDLDRAEQSARETLRLCESGGEPVTEGDARNMLGEILLWRGRCLEAVEEFSRALRLYRRSSVPHYEADVLGHLAVAASEIGDLAAAMEYGRQALRLARESAAHDDEVDARVAIAGLHRIRGEHDTADHAYKTALALCQEVGYQRGELSALLGQAENNRIAGDLVAAERNVLAALHVSESCGFRIMRGRGNYALALIALDRGDVVTATGHAKTAVAIGQESGAELDVGRAWYALGRANAADGRLDEAQRCWSKAQICLTATELPETSQLARLLADVKTGVGCS